MNCPVCDHEMPKNSKFCSNCGCCVDKSLAATPVASVSANRNKRVFQILFFVACAVIAGLIALWLINRNSAGNEQAVNEMQLAEYEQRLERYEQQIAEYEKALSEEKEEMAEPFVIIPADESYIYHYYDCEHYDHSIYCYVTDKEMAEENGCTPCPYCIDRNGR